MCRFKHLIVWLCLLILCGCENNKISPLEEQWRRLKVEEKILEEYIKKSEKLEALNQFLQKKVKTVEQLKSVQGLIAPMLTGVLQRIPTALQLKEFFYSGGTIDLIVTVPRDQVQHHWEKFLENSGTFKNISYYPLEEKFAGNIRAYRIVSDFTPGGRQCLFSPPSEKTGEEKTKQESLSEKSGKQWLKDSIQKTRQRIARGNKARESGKSIDQEIEKKTGLLQRLGSKLPDQVKTKQVLTDIYNAASDSQVKIKHLRIKEKIMEKSLSKKPIHLETCATVTQLTRFISTIENAALIYRLDTFYLDIRSNSTPGCDEYMLKFYVFQDIKPTPRGRMNRARRRR